MGILKIKFKKDKPPFSDRTESEVTGKKLTDDDRKQIFEAINKLQKIGEDLEKIGFESKSIYFSIKTKI